jgi:hypothetical protein
VSADYATAWDDPIPEVREGDEIPPQQDQSALSDSAAETALQIEEATARLGSIQELQPQSWEQLDAAQRLETLQSVENQMADIQGRPSIPVVMAEMSANTFGQFNGRELQINSATLSNAELPVSEFVDTIVHEGRHGYQYYAVEHPGFDGNSEKVQAWAENFKPENYLDPEKYGQELYQNQPVEADAWDYAARVTTGLYQPQR